MAFTYTPKQLTVGTALTNALATYYTAPTAYGTIVKEIILCNTDGSARTVNVEVIPLAGSAGTAYIIYSALSLQAGETKVLSLATVLPLGSFIQASASVGAVVTIRMSGVEIS